MTLNGIWRAQVAYAMLIVVMALAQQPKSEADKYPPAAFLKSIPPLHELCVEITGVSESTIAKYSAGKQVNDAKLKCYMNCLFEEVNVISDDGILDMKRIRHILPAEIRRALANITENCQQPEGANLCEKAWWYHQCWKKNDPIHYFLP